MPRIINAYSTGNPLAKTIADLGNSLFGDTLTPAVNRQKLQSAQREEFGIDGLAKVFGAGTDIDPHKAAEMAVLGGMKPEDIAMMNTYIYGNKYGPRDTRTTNAMAGAGKYKDSADAFDIGETNKISMNAADNDTSRANNAASNANSYSMNERDNERMWNEFLQKPEAALDTQGNPVFAPQGDLASGGYAPRPSSEAQISPLQKVNDYIKAADVALPNATPEQKRAWVLQQVSKSVKKGTTVYGEDGDPIVEIGGDAVSGFDPTNAVTTQLQKQTIAYDKFKNTLAMAKDVAVKNPNVFGIVGMARQGIQDTNQIAQSIGDVLGIQDVGQTLAAVQADGKAKGLPDTIWSPKYDPALGQIESLGKILAYTGATSIAEQSGNDLSDKDIERIEGILGDPRDWAMNQKRFLTKVAQVEAYVDSQMAINNKYLFGTPGAKTQSVAPQAPDAQSGAVVQPPMQGAKQAPDGKWYVPDPNRPGKYLMVEP